MKLLHIGIGRSCASNIAKSDHLAITANENSEIGTFLRKLGKLVSKCYLRIHLICSKEVTKYIHL